jgi:hypothetical protein
MKYARQAGSDVGRHRSLKYKTRAAGKGFSEALAAGIPTQAKNAWVGHPRGWEGA